MRDVGAGTLALGVALALAAWWLDRRVVITAVVAFLTFTVPHTVFHSLHLEHFPLVDAVLQQTGFLVEIVLAVAVLVLVVRDGELLTGRPREAPHDVGDRGPERRGVARGPGAGELVEREAVEAGDEVVGPALGLGDVQRGERRGHALAHPGARRLQGRAQLGASRRLQRELPARQQAFLVVGQPAPDRRHGGRDETVDRASAPRAPRSPSRTASAPPAGRRRPAGAPSGCGSSTSSCPRRRPAAPSTARWVRPRLPARASTAIAASARTSRRSTIRPLPRLSSTAVEYRLLQT